MKTPKKIAQEILKLLPSEADLCAYEERHKGRFLYLANRPAPTGVTASEKTYRIRGVKELLQDLIREDEKWFCKRNCLEETWDIFKNGRVKNNINESLEFALEEEHGYWMATLLWEKMFEGTPLEWKGTLRIEGYGGKQRVFYKDDVVFCISPEGEFQKWVLWEEPTWDLPVQPLMEEDKKLRSKGEENVYIEVSGFDAFVQIKKILGYNTDALETALKSPLLAG